MSVFARVAKKVMWTRPLPQIRVLRSYGVSPLTAPRLFLRFAFLNRETSNFTYDISNEDELVAFVANSLGESSDHIGAFLSEIAHDTGFTQSLTARLTTHRGTNPRPLFGRRLGWYAFVRAAKPRLVVETGTADGLGTALLARALQRNEAEGRGGRLISFDIDPAAGWLLTDELRQTARIIIGDAAECMAGELGGERVDLFIHDSLHTYEHEKRELEIALEHAAPTIVLISDNAHTTTALRDVATLAGGRYSFFRERPVGHFYPGAGIGLAIVRRQASSTSGASR